MVDEPLHVASRRRVSGAGAMLAVACVVCVGPLSRATRVSAVVCPRFCAQVGQSAREGRWPLSGVSWAWRVTYRGAWARNLLRTVLYTVHMHRYRSRQQARLNVLAGAKSDIGDSLFDKYDTDKSGFLDIDQICLLYTSPSPRDS